MNLSYKGYARYPDMVALVRPAQNEEEKVLKKRFTEMAVLSFSVAAVSFLIGYALKTVTGIEA
jgi:hypothetical protein